MKKAIYIFYLLSISNYIHAQTLKILSGENLPPYVFNQNDEGLDNAIVKASFKDQGLNVKFIKVPFARVRLNYDTPNIDCSSSVSKESNLKGTYSDPYITYMDVVFKLKSTQLPIIKSPKDLTPFSVMSFQDAHLYFGPEYEKMTRDNKTYVEVNNQLTQVQKLVSKQIDFVVSDINIFNYWFNKSKLNEKLSFNETFEKFDIFKKIKYQIVCKSKKTHSCLTLVLKTLKQEVSKNHCMKNMEFSISRNKNQNKYTKTYL